MDKQTLTTDDLPIGKPLPWPVYGRDGTLVLSRGYVLQSDAQRMALLASGLFRNPDEAAPETTTGQTAPETTTRQTAPETTTGQTAPETNTGQTAPKTDTGQTGSETPLRMLQEIKQGLWQLLDDMKYQRLDDYNLRIHRLSSRFDQLCNSAADAVLGALLLDSNSRYTLLHPIMCAVVCGLVSRNLGYENDRLLALLSAALTQNIGMLEIQETLANQTEPLSEDQRAEIQGHPERGVAILRKIGIHHEPWLRIIQMHHEKPDGSGYPQGLRENQIIQEARILSLADIYAAMILPRRYRDGLHVQRAMREIFMQRGKLVDDQLAHVFIKEMGVFPPGCFVRLASGETGMVTRRGKKTANHALIHALYDPAGKPYQRPILRDTSIAPGHAIKQIIRRPDNTEIDLEQLWKPDMDSGC